MNSLVSPVTATENQYQADKVV